MISTLLKIAGEKLLQCLALGTAVLTALFLARQSGKRAEQQEQAAETINVLQAQNNAAAKAPITDQELYDRLENGEI